MGNNGNGNGQIRGFENRLTLTRRDFLKTTAVATTAGGLLEYAANATPAYAVPNPAAPTVSKTSMTTCLCCSVGCGQLVDIDADGKVLDIYGDPNHVVNAAANCPKGAASILNVTGDRRLGVQGSVVSALPWGVSTEATLSNGPWKRTGNGAWGHISWDTAMSEIATKLQGAVTTYGSVPATANTNGQVSNNGVAFFGCSHATNEENYLYRKIIANLGSNNIEHQARV